jgi:hypothetical protein
MSSNVSAMGFLTNCWRKLKRLSKMCTPKPTLASRGQLGRRTSASPSYRLTQRMRLVACRMRCLRRHAISTN